MRTILIISLAVILSSCMKKSPEQCLHLFAGTWKIEKFTQSKLNASQEFEDLRSLEDIGFFTWYDNMSDITSYNSCEYILPDTLPVYSINLLNLPSGSGQCYWYSNDVGRISLWRETINDSYYTTFTVEDRSDNKLELYFYYWKNDYTATDTILNYYRETYEMKRMKR